MTINFAIDRGQIPTHSAEGGQSRPPLQCDMIDSSTNRNYIVASLSQEEEPQGQHMEGVEGIEGQADGLLHGRRSEVGAGLLIIEEQERQRQEGENLCDFPSCGDSGGCALYQIGYDMEDRSVENCQESTYGHPQGLVTKVPKDKSHQDPLGTVIGLNDPRIAQDPESHTG